MVRCVRILQSTNAAGDRYRQYIIAIHQVLNMSFYELAAKLNNAFAHSGAV